jgi:hypothetical protein
MNLNNFLIRKMTLYLSCLLFISLFWSCGDDIPLYEAVKTSIKPKIDGKIDSLWNNIKSEPIKNIMHGYYYSIPRDSSDLSASFKMMWDDTNLYFLLDVTDDFKCKIPVSKYKLDSVVPWHRDEVELYLAMKNRKKKSFSLLKGDFQYSFLYGKNEINSTSLSSVVGIDFAQTDRKGGYIAELSIPFKTLHVIPNENYTFGFEIVIFDNDQDLSSGKYYLPLVSAIAWSEKGEAPIAFKNTSVCGDIKLVNRKISK